MGLACAAFGQGNTIRATSETNSPGGAYYFQTLSNAGVEGAAAMEGVLGRLSFAARTRQASPILRRLSAWSERYHGEHRGIACTVAHAFAAASRRDHSDRVKSYAARLTQAAGVKSDAELAGAIKDEDIEALLADGVKFAALGLSQRAALANQSETPVPEDEIGAYTADMATFYPASETASPDFREAAGRAYRALDALGRALSEEMDSSLFPVAVAVTGPGDEHAGPRLLPSRRRMKEGQTAAVLWIIENLDGLKAGTLGEESFPPLLRPHADRILAALANSSAKDVARGAGFVTHQLSNVFDTLVGLFAIFSPGDSMRPLVEMGREATKEGSDLVHSINTLLIYSSGAKEADSVPVDIYPIFETELRSAAQTPHHKAKGISVRNDLPAGLRVRGDSQLIALVINNIVENAYKYTANGGVIEVSLRAAPADAGSIEIVFKNSPPLAGKGLGAGRGLGESIVRTSLVLMGGEPGYQIRYESGADAFTATLVFPASPSGAP